MLRTGQEQRDDAESGCESRRPCPQKKQNGWQTTSFHAKIKQENFKGTKC